MDDVPDSKYNILSLSKSDFTNKFVLKNTYNFWY